jgi:hypothetical protein
MAWLAATTPGDDTGDPRFPRAAASGLHRPALPWLPAIDRETAAMARVVVSPDSIRGATAATVACFRPGTRIATPGGATPVEALLRGQLVHLADGRDLPVRWLGWQAVSRRFADPLTTLPVRIRAGALAEGLPARDLLVSPGHALLLNGALVQAGALLGLPGVTRDYVVPPMFFYYHVELDEHALLLAEGVAAESYRANGEDAGFDNRETRPAGTQPPALAYPRVTAASHLPPALRARLEQRTAA